MNFLENNKSLSPLLSYKNILILFTLGVIINLLFLVYYSFDLRPAADDYCFGSVAAEYGYLYGIIYWWNTWTGDVYPFLVMHTIVGLPLANFSENYISFLPFLLSLAGVGLTVFTLVHLHNKNLIKYKILFILFITFFWWIFLWSGELTGLSNDTTILIARGLTHWQNLTGAFVSIQLLFITMILTYIAIQKKQSYIYTILFILLGITVGTTGSVMSLTIFITSILYISYLVYCKIKYNIYNKSLIYLFIFFSLAIVIGVLIATNSPGYIIRKSILNPNLDFNIEKIIDMIRYVIINTSKIFIKMHLNIGILFIIVIVPIIFSNKFFNELSSFDKRFFLKISILSSLFSLLLLSVTIFSEFLTYQGYWHYNISYFFIFLSFLFFSIYLGVSLQPSWNKIIFLIVLIVITFSTYTNKYAVDIIIQRNINWENGAAPILGISDIQDNDGWQMKCWNRLNESREMPLLRKTNFQ